jgi:Tfp pilus assembly protein PilO
MTQARRWSLLAVLLAAAILASGWFLLVSPTRGDASVLREETATAETANVQLRSKLQQLKALAPELPKREAEFAAIRRQIPDNPALPELIRQLNAAADKSSVDLISLAPGTPVAIVTSTAPVAAGSAAPVKDELLQVPLTLEMQGSYSQLEDFVGKLEGLRRAMLVTAFTLKSKDEAEGGDTLTLSVTGRVYMVNAGTAQTPAATGATSTTTTGGTAPAPSPAQ